jgi:hypothetical protein
MADQTQKFRAVPLSRIPVTFSNATPLLLCGSGLLSGDGPGRSWKVLRMLTPLRSCFASIGMWSCRRLYDLFRRGAVSLRERRSISRPYIISRCFLAPTFPLITVKTSRQCSDIPVKLFHTQVRAALCRLLVVVSANSLSITKLHHRLRTQTSKYQRDPLLRHGPTHHIDLLQLLDLKS